MPNKKLLRLLPLLLCLCLLPLPALAACICGDAGCAAGGCRACPTGVCRTLPGLGPASNPGPASGGPAAPIGGDPDVVFSNFPYKEMYGYLLEKGNAPAFGITLDRIYLPGGMLHEGSRQLGFAESVVKENGQTGLVLTHRSLTPTEKAIRLYLDRQALVVLMGKKFDFVQFQGPLGIPTRVDLRELKEFLGEDTQRAHRQEELKDQTVVAADIPAGAEGLDAATGFWMGGYSGNATDASRDARNDFLANVDNEDAYVTVKYYGGEHGTGAMLDDKVTPGSSYRFRECKFVAKEVRLIINDTQPTFTCWADRNGNQFYPGREFSHLYIDLHLTAQWYVKKGCFIATAVYGTPDCPEVWTLRRFRDGTLAGSEPGVALIDVYYALSQPLVEQYGKEPWFSGEFKPALDKLVAWLNDQGVSGEPYAEDSGEDLPAVELLALASYMQDDLDTLLAGLKQLDDEGKIDLTALLDSVQVEGAAQNAILTLLRASLEAGSLDPAALAGLLGQK